MDLYAGNSTLYRFLKRYRQPVFMDRNLHYLFDARATGAPMGQSNGTAQNYSDSGQQSNALSVSMSRRRSAKTKRRRVAIDDVCERLMTAQVMRSATAALMNPARSAFVVQPVLKIEAVGLVKLARSQRRHVRGLPVNLRATHCRCEIRMLKMLLSETSKRKGEELVFQSSETCTIIPGREVISAPNVNRAAETNREHSLVASVIMDEPFYIKASTLADAGVATLLSSKANDYMYKVTLTLKSMSTHSERSWPFAMDTTPVSTPNRQVRSTSNSPRDKTHSRNTSASPSPKGTRHSPRNKKPTAAAAAASPSPGRRGRMSTVSSAVASIRRRLLPSASPLAGTRSDCDADDEQDEDEDTDGPVESSTVEISAEFSFSLLECPPSGFVSPLEFVKNGKLQEVKSGTAIGIEMDMGWSVPTGQNIQNSTSKAESADEIKSTKITEELNTANGTVAILKKDDSREQSTTRTATPVPERDTLEARYHFAVNGKFKTYVLSGFGCPWCNDKDFYALERLHFHFLTCHDLFTFRVEMRRPLLMDVYITLAGEFLYERASPKVPDIRVIQWMRPSYLKFKLANYLRGDMTWLQEGVSLLVMQMPMDNRSRSLHGRGNASVAASLAGSVTSTTVDENMSNMGLVSSVSSMHNVRTVPELPPRTKRLFPVPEAEVDLYTTKAKRKLKTGEVMPESEDDNDDSWLIHKHDETIDDFEDVTANEKTFMKAWDRHIFEERPSAYKHVSESLLRFCRANGELLSSEPLKKEFWKHCLNFVDYGIIEPACMFACATYLKNLEVEREQSTAEALVSGSGSGSGSSDGHKDAKSRKRRKQR
ncbi:uncharacterized protein V1518DRAFT_421546 [Limtongia smithiae]|uniref:uncharacterized protein n=1 Tax=Limtongia smithiae TaxID=1125753 RepID=UPI0034CE1615